MSEASFYLSDGEQVIRDADRIVWYGAGAGRINLADVGIGSSATVWGILSSAGIMLVKKASKKVESKTIHVFLTSERLVFMNSPALVSVGLQLPGQMASSTHMLYEIPLETIKVMLPVIRLGAPSIEIQKGFPHRGIETLTLSFHTGEDTGNLRNRDEWLRLVEECRAQLVRRRRAREGQVVSLEDPALVLKLRYAKGEISKEQYLEMNATLLEMIRR